MEVKDVQDCWRSEARMKRNTNIIGVYHRSKNNKKTMMLVRNYGGKNAISYTSLV